MLTIEERDTLITMKHMGCKWIARDSYGTTRVYSAKPYKSGLIWAFDGAVQSFKCDNYDAVSCNDKEPTLIADLLKECGCDSEYVRAPSDADMKEFMGISATDERIQLIEIFETFGLESQCGKILEEANELVEALKSGDFIHAMEEMSDLQIVMDGVNKSLHMDLDLMIAFRKYKIKRTIERIENGYYDEVIEVEDTKIVEGLSYERCTNIE